MSEVQQSLWCLQSKLFPMSARYVQLKEQEVIWTLARNKYSLNLFCRNPSILSLPGLRNRRNIGTSPLKELRRYDHARPWRNHRLSWLCSLEPLQVKSFHELGLNLLRSGHVFTIFHSKFTFTLWKKMCKKRFSVNEGQVSHRAEVTVQKCLQF